MSSNHEEGNSSQIGGTLNIPRSWIVGFLLAILGVGGGSTIQLSSMDVSNDIIKLSLEVKQIRTDISSLTMRIEKQMSDRYTLKEGTKDWETHAVAHSYIRKEIERLSDRIDLLEKHNTP